MEQIIRDFGALMQAHEGQVFGTFDLTFPKANPNGSDVRFELTYPDWKNIGSIPAKR
jgi:hypothetical protein